MGKSFKEYLLEYRLQIAKELLLDGTYNVNEVCAMVGYKNLDYFRKAFKAYTGFNPSHFAGK